VSYGHPDDPDMCTAREIANAIGFDFSHGPISVDHFTDAIEDDVLLRAAIDEVGITTRFTCGAGARVAPIPDDGVVLTGHTGFLSSALVRMNWGVHDKASVRRMTFGRHYRYERSEILVPRALRFDYDAVRYTSLDETLANFDDDADPLGEMHRWNEEQRQRNLVFMEYRAYERRSPWMMPLAANDLVDLFASAPYSIRVDQIMYKQMLLQMCSGRAEPLAHISRVGGKLEVSDREYRKFHRIQQTQPVSGAVVTRVAPFLKVHSRRQRRAAPLRYGPAPIRQWFLTDGRFRAAMLERIDAISTDLLRPDAIRAAALDPRSGEWVYQLLVAGAITTQATADYAADVWRAANRGSNGQGRAPTGTPSMI
jgi:hypothetical protein